MSFFKDAFNTFLLFYTSTVNKLIFLGFNTCMLPNLNSRVLFCTATNIGTMGCILHFCNWRDKFQYVLWFLFYKVKLNQAANLPSGQELQWFIINTVLNICTKMNCLILMVLWIFNPVKNTSLCRAVNVHNQLQILCVYKGYQSKNIINVITFEYQAWRATK